MMRERVVMREGVSKMAFMKTLFHELVHFKSYNAVQVTTGKDRESMEYRTGLSTITRDGKKEHLLNLNEAVTEELTKRYVLKLFEHPMFMQEKEKTADIIFRNPNAVTNTGEPLFNEDTFFVTEKK